MFGLENWLDGVALGDEVEDEEEEEEEEEDEEEEEKPKKKASTLSKLLAAQKKSTEKQSSSSSSSSSSGKNNVDEATLKTLNKLFEMKLKADSQENVSEQILSGADLSTVKIKQIAKTYKMHSNYQSAGKTTNKKAFVSALIKKLK